MKQIELKLKFVDPAVLSTKQELDELELQFPEELSVIEGTQIYWIP